MIAFAFGRYLTNTEKITYAISFIIMRDRGETQIMVRSFWRRNAFNTLLQPFITRHQSALYHTMPACDSSTWVHRDWPILIPTSDIIGAYPNTLRSWRNRKCAGNSSVFRRGEYCLSGLECIVHFYEAHSLVSAVFIDVENLAICLRHKILSISCWVHWITTP